MAAREDEDLLRLQKPQSSAGKEEDWTEWGFVMRSYLAIQSNEVGILTEAAENPAEPDVSVEAIRQRMGENGVAAARKLFHLLVMSVKCPALAVLRSNRDQNGATAWRLLMKRYEPNTAPA